MQQCMDKTPNAKIHHQMEAAKHLTKLALHTITVPPLHNSSFPSQAGVQGGGAGSEDHQFDSHSPCEGSEDHDEGENHQNIDRHIPSIHVSPRNRPRHHQLQGSTPNPRGNQRRIPHRRIPIPSNARHRRKGQTHQRSRPHQGSHRTDEPRLGQVRRHTRPSHLKHSGRPGTHQLRTRTLHQGEHRLTDWSPRDSCSMWHQAGTKASRCTSASQPPENSSGAAGTPTAIAVTPDDITAYYERQEAREPTGYDNRLQEWREKEREQQKPVGATGRSPEDEPQLEAGLFAHLSFAEIDRYEAMSAEEQADFVEKQRQYRASRKSAGALAYNPLSLRERAGVRAEAPSPVKLEGWDGGENLVRGEPVEPPAASSVRPELVEGPAQQNTPSPSTDEEPAPSESRGLSCPEQSRRDRRENPENIDWNTPLQDAGVPVGTPHPAHPVKPQAHIRSP